MLARRLIFALPLLVFAAVGVYFYLGLGRDPSAVPSALLDRPVPAFDLPPLLEAKPGLAQSDLGQGRPALVNVFASWCAPCKAEHPLLMRLAAEGVPVHGINYKDRPEDARRFLAQLGDPYARIGVDRDGRAAIEWGVYGVPETFVVDGAGRIRHRHVGPLTERDLDRVIRPLLKQGAR
jgi:cytochrome c biogenesis protein CcmG/thiol:disulfide interchange protein DsbE